MATTSSSKVTLKLLINKKESKVIFAEANKDFVDFLFYIFSLPFGSIVKFLKNETMVGCFGDLYQSLETLSEPYVLSNQKKNSALDPKPPICSTEIPLFQSDNIYVPKAMNFYTCSNCPSCSKRMNFSFGTAGSRAFPAVEGPSPFGAAPSLFGKAPSPFRAAPSPFGAVASPFAVAGTSTDAVAVAVAERGWVKDVVSYMVMDNLEVKPMSTISCITLINQFNIENLGSLEEKVVDFGLDEGLKLLKASMECNNVLTRVFLENMEA